MKLGLGTAQFGLDYGISNCEGKAQQAEIQAIVQKANACGVTVIDTASAYGTSESELGNVLQHQKSVFKVVTKLPAVDVQQNAIADFVAKSAAQSLARLNLTAGYGFLVHDANDLIADRGKELYRALVNLKETSLFQKIGVSVYDSRQIDAVLDRYEIDLIQIPFNVFDQRLLRSGHLARLKEAGVEVHARSAFLQGLLLMDPGQLPEYFVPYQGAILGYHAELSKNGLSPLRAALSFALKQPFIDVVICGVTNVAQFTELINVAEEPLAADQLSFADSMAIDDPYLVNPALWRR